MSTLVFEINPANHISYRLTPWDEKAFGFKTSELVSLEYTNRADLKTLTRHFNDYNRTEKVHFSYTRIDAGDFYLKEYLQKDGFYFAETSIALELGSLEGFSRQPGIPELILERATDADREAIKDIARSAFDYGRFHEDANIPGEKARLRFANWIDDLALQGKEMYVSKIRNEIMGFHIQEVREGEAHLILTGCKKGKSALAVPLWCAALSALKDRDVRLAHTMISAANLGVFNLYIYLQFRVVKTWLGLHKFYG